MGRLPARQDRHHRSLNHPSKKEEKHHVNATHHQAGSINITKFRVIENTGEYRGGKYVEHDTPTTHFVEAGFELGENTAAARHKGDPVIVIGREHTSSWGRTTTAPTAESSTSTASAWTSPAP